MNLIIFILLPFCYHFTYNHSKKLISFKKIIL
nr:MAG TPA: hypothetical protein [Caudoviricetes sp.]